MKKIMALILDLSLVCIILLTGCGSNSISSNANTNVSSAGSDDGKYYEWSLSCEYSADNHQTIALQDAADKIAKQTDGHIKITVYPNMALGDYTVVYGQVMTGDIEIAACPISTQYDPRADVMVLPYLSSSFEEFETNYFEGSYMWDLYNDITSQKGVKLLGFFNSGFMGLGAKKVDEEDFAYLTDGSIAKTSLMRCPGSTVYSETMAAMGYKTTTIPYSDLYAALQSGLCDGWLGGSGLVNYDGFRDVIKYFIDCKCINESIPVMMNAELFNSLNKDYQEIITDVFAQMQRRVNSERREQEAKALVDMKNYGITVIEPTEEQLDILQDNIRKAVWPKMAETLGQDVITKVCEVYNVNLY